MPELNDVRVFTVHRLKLASWLFINHQRLLGRQLDELGQHVAYHFEYTDEIEALVDQWINKNGIVDLRTMATFAESVSFEIRIAARLRRGEDVSRLHFQRRLRKPTSASQQGSVA